VIKQFVKLNVPTENASHHLTTVNVKLDGKDLFVMNQFVFLNVLKVKENVLTLVYVNVKKDGLEQFVTHLFVMIVIMEHVEKMIFVFVHKDGQEMIV